MHSLDWGIQRNIEQVRIFNRGILNLYQYLGQKIAVKSNKAIVGGGIYSNVGTINPADYSNCIFGTGPDANTPNDHTP